MTGEETCFVHVNTSPNPWANVEPELESKFRLNAGSVAFVAGVEKVCNLQKCTKIWRSYGPSHEDT